jgi:hypothetical protein
MSAGAGRARGLVLVAVGLAARKPPSCYQRMAALSVGGSLAAGAALMIDAQRLPLLLAEEHGAGHPGSPVRAWPEGTPARPLPYRRRGRLEGSAAKPPVFDAATAWCDGDPNGLITNDKFCMSRTGRLELTWWRRPRRLRSQVAGKWAYSPDERVHRGGAYEAPVETSPTAASDPGRGASVGPSLPAPSAMGHSDRAESDAGVRVLPPSDAGGVP